MKSVFLSHIHHAYAQTDGTYSFPNSREGDMLKQAKREVESLATELEIAQKFYHVAISERDAVYAELNKQAGKVRAVFDRDVWERAKNHNKR